VNETLERALSDRYTIERELGRGGMATVFLATDARHHRKVAVKAPSLHVTSRHTLFALDEYDAAQPHANFDVSPDGKTFVMIHRAPTGRLTVIQNLPELVRRLSGAQRRCGAAEGWHDRDVCHSKSSSIRHVPSGDRLVCPRTPRLMRRRVQRSTRSGHTCAPC
jgi:serine/threonine protein kinase